MAIKIPLINIRRLYTTNENNLANVIHKNKSVINDILVLQKLKELKRLGKTQKNDLAELGINDFINQYNSEYLDKTTNSIKYFRDYKIVNKVEKFVKNNEHRISDDIIKNFSRNNNMLKCLRKQNEITKSFLDKSLSRGNNKRELLSIFNSDYVAISDSALASALNIKNDTISNDIIVVVVDQEEMMNDIILNDFTFNGVRYELYGASAGQLRKMKVMFVNTEKLKSGIHKLINGLTIERINKTQVGVDDEGNPIYGVNINKWSAYMSLPTSATDVWQDVDLHRVCVVEDFETILKDRAVDHIDSEYNVVRTTMDVVIPHTDGFGMMHPKFCRDSRIIRAPWIKGLLSPMDYRSFSRAFGGKEIITDIYGDEYNINDVDIILTKSQFKMWKYYTSWKEYVNGFYENECEFRFMIPESKKDLRLNALFNYQMWQTLVTDNTEKIAIEFLKKDMDLIESAHKEVGAMQNMFGVDKNYEKNSNINKALYLYPSLLHHKYFKKSLNDNLSARKSDLAEGRIKINGVYTFIIPDVFAWCEYLLLDKDIPNGLLIDGEVSCKLMPKNKEILVNRSPHLHRIEHCVKINRKNKEHIRWFLGKGVYTSTYDIISKRLFFDVDGDIALVVDNEELIKLAKETVKGLLPLDFELGKAKPQLITRENTLTSYKDSFKANIGYYSNLITKEMNSDRKDMDLVSQICWMNNMAIDMAKTNFFIEPTDSVNDNLIELNNSSLPYFFHWAKQKELTSVSHPNQNSLVDNMALYVFGDLKSGKKERVKYTKFDYHKLAKLDVSLLLRNKPIQFSKELDMKLKDKIKKISDTKYHTIVKKHIQNDDDFTDIKELDVFLKIEMYDFINNNNLDLDDVVDYYINYCFEKNVYISALFTIFGIIIVDRLEQRFSELLDGSQTRCEVCGEMVMINNNRTTMCESCAKIVKKKQDLEAIRRFRDKM